MTYLYIVNTGWEIKYYRTDTDTEFYNYFRNNIDEFRFVFTAVFLTDSKFHDFINKVFKKPRNLDNEHIWVPAKKDIENALNNMTDRELSLCLEADCDDGNTQPYIRVNKVRLSDIEQI